MRKLSLLAVLLLPWLIIVGIFCDGLSVHGAEESTYRIVLEDDADLLDETSKTELIQCMEQIQSYGHVAFKSINQNPATTEEFARQYYQDQFGTESGIVFVIDMQNRYIWIHSDGAVSEIITDDYADIITDNVYSYATNKSYYYCAKQVYKQAYDLLRGEKIKQPMKYISNALLGLVLSVLLHFVLMICSSRIRQIRKRNLLKNIDHHFQFTSEPTVNYTHNRPVYNGSDYGGYDGYQYKSGGSGGSGGGGFSGGSGGGSRRSGSRSGSGGGHRF